MKLGLLVEAEEGLDWERWRAILRIAERLEFDSIWLADHLQSPSVPARHGIEAWSALAVAAAETSRLRLGPLVSPVTFREPALMARMAEALDALSDGRFTLGLGLGWNAGEHATHGIPFPSVAERIRRLVEAVELTRAMCSRTRVLIGGMGEKATLPLVARYADEWNLTTASADVVAQRSATLAGLGRDPATVERSVAVGVLVGRDEDALRTRLTRLRHVVPNLDSVCAARAMGWVAGTPDEIVEQLQMLARAGIGAAMLGIYDFDDLEALELIARDVMPRL
jgi:alkanesulfonate monooxygenase SsuD/methylene tetrahydromethanopterin reductase-like flavin-dependent oxidoreductase (luciferase family)